jgi:hypothetical protein
MGGKMARQKREKRVYITLNDVSKLVDYFINDKSEICVSAVLKHSFPKGNFIDGFTIDLNTLL